MRRPRPLLLLAAIAVLTPSLAVTAAAADGPTLTLDPPQGRSGDDVPFTVTGGECRDPEAWVGEFETYAERDASGDRDVVRVPAMPSEDLVPLNPGTYEVRLTCSGSDAEEPVWVVSAPITVLPPTEAPEGAGALTVPSRARAGDEIEVSTDGGWFRFDDLTAVLYPDTGPHVVLHDDLTVLDGALSGTVRLPSDLAAGDVQLYVFGASYLDGPEAYAPMAAGSLTIEVPAPGPDPDPGGGPGEPPAPPEEGPGEEPEEPGDGEDEAERRARDLAALREHLRAGGTVEGFVLPSGTQVTGDLTDVLRELVDDVVEVEDPFAGQRRAVSEQLRAALEARQREAIEARERALRTQLEELARQRAIEQQRRQEQLLEEQQRRREEEAARRQALEAQLLGGGGLTVMEKYHLLMQQRAEVFDPSAGVSDLHHLVTVLVAMTQTLVPAQGQWQYLDPRIGTQNWFDAYVALPHPVEMLAALQAELRQQSLALPGVPATIQLHGFASWTVVDFAMASTVTSLGTAVADEDGTVTAVVELPVGTAPGAHTLYAISDDRAVVGPFSVASADDVAMAVLSLVEVPDLGAVPAPAPGPTPPPTARSGQLPRTGTDPVATALAGLAALVLGAGAAGAGARRARRSEVSR